MIVMCVVAASMADAGEPSVGSGNELMQTPAAIDAMVAKMSDDDVRKLLLDYLKSNAAKAAPADVSLTPIGQIERLWDAFLTPALTAITKLPALPGLLGQALTNFSENQGGSKGLLRLFGLIGLILAVSFGVERVVCRFIPHLKVPDPARADGSLWSALGFLFRRFLREFLGLVVFYLAVRSLGRIVLTPEELVFAGPFATYLVWGPRLIAAASRFLLAPGRPDLRLVSLDEDGVRFLYRNLIALFFLGGFNVFFVNFNLENGIAPEDSRVGFWLDSLVYVYIGLIAVFGHAALRRMMLGTDPDRTWVDELIADLYPRYVIIVAAGTWVLVSTLAGLGHYEHLLKGAHYVTLIFLLITPVADAAVRGMVRHLLPPMTGEGQAAEAAYLAAKRSYVRIGRVFVAGTFLFLIGHVWGFKLVELLQDVAGIGDNLFRFLITLLVGYVVFEIISVWVNRRLASEKEALGATPDAEEMAVVGSGSRLATVLPLVEVTAKSAIAIMFGLLAVSNLGVDIRPLLAGAGVVGIAIGFGAQKLVADIVSGAFFLIDDAFRIGEYIDIEGTMGTVEKISIRSMQLRHHRGPVHTIPYGEIPKLTNYSRDWVIMKLKFTVPFDTDPNMVKKIFKRIGAEMMADPLYKDDFLQPFKSQGVFDFDDTGMVIRGKYMAKPGTQFTIRKEIYNRVKLAFAENGIEFARREIRVMIPNAEHHDTLSEADEETIAAAAASAFQDEEGAG